MANGAASSRADIQSSGEILLLIRCRCSDGGDRGYNLWLDEPRSGAASVAPDQGERAGLREGRERASTDIPRGKFSAGLSSRPPRARPASERR
jgi:hypothetical protein